MLPLSAALLMLVVTALLAFLAGWEKGFKDARRGEKDGIGAYRGYSQRSQTAFPTVTGKPNPFLQARYAKPVDEKDAAKD